MPPEFDRIEVPGSLAGQRLDRVLDQLEPDLSRSQLQKLVRRGRVRLNGKRVLRSNGAVPRGAVLEIAREEPGGPQGGGGPAEATVLHEDADLLVVVKPSGWLTHAADRARAADLAAHLEARFGPLPTSRGVDRPGVVHRLDRETSGVLVFARSEAVLRALQDQFRAHTVGKRYLALVTGRPAPSFTVDAPLGPVPGKADRQMVDAADGKEAVTEVELVEQFERHALVACTIRTGRRHQIRVHLTARGLPVAGDPLYGTRAHAPLPGGRLRLALHAERLAFDHPGTGERVAFEAPLPRDLSAAVEALRRRP